MHLYVLPTDLHNPYSPNILRSKGARKRGDLTTAIFIKAFPFSWSHIISPPSAKTTGRAAESGRERQHSTSSTVQKRRTLRLFPFRRLPLTVYENRRCVTDPPDSFCALLRWRPAARGNNMVRGRTLIFCIA